MGIFKNKENDSPSSVPAASQPKVSVNKEVISSVIAEQMEITGELRFKGKARIDGQLHGNLHGEALVLSKSGRVDGDMILESLICHGKVTGNITAKVVTVHSSACIKGKLIAESLTVEPGALLSGEISAADKGARTQEIPVLNAPKRSIAANDEPKNKKKEEAVSGAK
ncbi:bactofilin family protein [Desulfogranum japonicum]|uniref:bactofilin family protein n=1 Tax=Desulfogranum japonicum TaxID=231447 RepID=UPI00042430A8|nr:polymer-forming cytoskeletal protein [Desulfogranum japonicum]